MVRSRECCKGRCISSYQLKLPSSRSRPTGLGFFPWWQLTQPCSMNRIRPRVTVSSVTGGSGDGVDGGSRRAVGLGIEQIDHLLLVVVVEVGQRLDELHQPPAVVLAQVAKRRHRRAVHPARERAEQVGVLGHASVGGRAALELAVPEIAGIVAGVPLQRRGAVAPPVRTVAAAAVLLEQGQAALQRRQIGIASEDRLRIDGEERRVHLDLHVRQHAGRAAKDGLGPLETVAVKQERIAAAGSRLAAGAARKVLKVAQRPIRRRGRRRIRFQARLIGVGRLAATDSTAPRATAARRRRLQPAKAILHDLPWTAVAKRSTSRSLPSSRSA